MLVFIFPVIKLILSCLFRLIKEFDRQAKDLESRNDPEANNMLNDKKKKEEFMVCCYLYFYLALDIIDFC